MKKLIALVLALALVLAVAVASATVNITVNRDNSYNADGATESGNRTYTYYQIFRATETSNHTSTGGGADADGTPGTVTNTPTNGISYYLLSTDTTQIGQLGTWNESSKTWSKATNNAWFKLTKTADGSKYIVEWDNAAVDTDTVQNAARWLKANYTPLASHALTPSDNGASWTASDLDEGYYLLEGETGQNLIAATVDITVNEKNTYPTIDKQQKDSASGSYVDTAIGVKVGDTVYYQVSVDVPADANADIVVTDTMSDGLTFDTTSNPVVKVGENALTLDTDATHINDYVIGTKTAQSWVITIHPTANTKNHTVVITFTATVNSSALTTINRKNDVELVYGNFHSKDTVEHDIGAAAIIKYDGATADVVSDELQLKTGATSIKYLDASFTLTDSSDNAVNVSLVSGYTKGVYVVDSSSTSNTVTSDKTHDGIILIYGLDPDVNYKLTETATEDGYNLLKDTVPLTIVTAEKSSVNTIKVVAQGVDGITAGNASADGDHTLTLTPAQVSKVANNQGTVLPSTGGIGTTIFYVLGGLLVVGAAVILVARRKASN